MTIVGFNFTKILAHKQKSIDGKINISNKVSITDIEQADLALGKDKQQGVKFIFNYASKYEPDAGMIELEGDLLYLTDPKEVKTIIDEWKKSKKVPQAVMGSILNTVLTKCNIQSLIMSKDVNLPPSVQLPKVQINK